MNRSPDVVKRPGMTVTHEKAPAGPPRAPPRLASQAAFGNGVANAVALNEPSAIARRPNATSNKAVRGSGAAPMASPETTVTIEKPPPPLMLASQRERDRGQVYVRPDVAGRAPPQPLPAHIALSTPGTRPGDVQSRLSGQAAPAEAGTESRVHKPAAVSAARTPGNGRNAVPDGYATKPPGGPPDSVEAGKQPTDEATREAVASTVEDAASRTEEFEEKPSAEQSTPIAKPRDVPARGGLPKPAVVAEQAAKPAQAGGGTPTGSEDVSAWRARVSSATAATPKPTLGSAPAASITVISGAGKNASASRRAGGARIPEDAKKAVRKPPEVPKQLPPPPPTPVPAADQLITDASKPRLPDQTLPQLQRYTPDANTAKLGIEFSVPRMDTEFAADIGSAINPPREDAKPEAASGEKQPLDDRQAKKIKDARKKEPETDKRAKPGEELVLTDTAPTPTPGVEVGTKGQSRKKVALVLAELLRGQSEEATRIVTEARQEAYPQRALEREFSNIGYERRSEVLDELKTQADQIRAIAGISAAELDVAVKTREESLAKAAAGARDAFESAMKDAKEETGKSGEETAEKIAGARGAIDEDTIQKMVAATGEADPEVVKLRRDKGLRDLARRAARQDVFFEKAGERRARALDASLTRMLNAYKNAAKADQKVLYERKIAEAGKVKRTGARAERAKAEADAAAKAKAESEAEARPLFEWAARHTLDLKRQFQTLKDEAARKTKEFRDGIKSALESAKEMLRHWAEQKVAEQESWWESLIRRFREWRQDAEDDAAAWEEARNESLRDSLVGDLQLIDDIHAAQASGLNMQAMIQERGLDQAQATVLQTYFGGETGAQLDAIGAVAAGMRMRIRVSRKPGITEYMKSELMKKPDSEWKKLGEIGNAERPPFNVVALGSDLYQAMDQWGTDEGKIFAALANLTPVQARAIRAYYQIRYKRSLDEHLDAELSGAELTRATALLEGKQTVADVAALREAMSGPGTDEDAIMQVLRNKTPEERAAIEAEYKKRYGVDLKAELKSELDDGWSSHHDLDRANALMAGDTATADAIAADQAMHGGITGLGTDEGAITRIYEQTRSEVEAEAARKGWSTDQMEAEIRRRNLEIERKYEKKYGDPKREITGAPARDGQPSALRRAFKSELSGAELDLANALADNDIVAADAARIGVEKESFITSDETVNKVLESQYTRARKNLERDKNLDLAFRAEVDALQDKPWSHTRWAEERSKAKHEIDEESKKQAKLNMSALENAFDDKYSRFGKGGLQVLIAFNMSGDDQRKARDLIKQGGRLEPAQEVFYAVNGIGTDVDALKRVLKDKSPDEVKAIRKQWKKLYPNEPDLDSRIMEEVSGRDAQDMKWGLEGEPQTLDGKVKRAEARMNYEKTAYWLGSSFSDSEREFMESEYKALVEEKASFERFSLALPPQDPGESRDMYTARLLDEADALREPRREGESKEAYTARMASAAKLSAQLDSFAYARESFNLQEAYFDRSVEDHRTAVDSLADTVANVAAIIATVVVIAVASFFTAGTGGAAIIAALASAKVAAAAALAAAAATIASKQLLKGSAYSWQEMGVDALVGVVDAVVSYATAGLGGGLLKSIRAGQKVPQLARLASNSKVASKLAKAAASERMVTRLFANAMAEGVEGVASTLPSALVGNVLDEKNWVKGSPLTNILSGTIVQTGVGVALSGGLGSLGGIGKHVDDVAGALPSGRKALAGELAESGDVLARRGEPVDRLATWKGWSLDNPGRPYKEFLDEFDAGLIAKDADDAAKKALQREMRGELLSGIPPARRGQFADVPIRVMSDAEFERFTRSASGQAVVIFENGKPRVILREGADVKALREEGIHLLQSKDPRFARKIAALDETRLANWKNLDLDEQLDLYRSKIDIELDAQQRLIKSLDDQLASVDDPALRKSLMGRREGAVKNLENLKGRLDEVSAITPTERLKIARGELDPPQYLDQEPRLFSKRAHDPAKSAELADVLDRKASAGKATAAITDSLEGAATTRLEPQISRITAALREISVDLGGRMTSFLAHARRIIRKEGKFPTDMFDVSLALSDFVKVIQRDLSGIKNLSKLDEFTQGVRTLLNDARLNLWHVDAFLKVAPRFDKPVKLFALVDTLASLPTFRRKALPGVAEVIGKITRKKSGGARLAAEFSDELSELAAKVKVRDAVDKAKDLPGWLKAQKALDDACEALQDKAMKRFGLAKREIEPILEEMSKSGRFDWKIFKEALTEANPLDKEKFAPLKKLFTELKQAVISGKKQWIDTDVGPILHWAPLIKKLYGELDGPAQKKLIGDLKDVLKRELPNLKVGGYKKYRHALRDRVMNHVMTGGSPKRQFAIFQEFMEIVREQDNASMGEYFAAFRRKIFENKPRAIQGPLSGARDKKLASRQIHGTKRMVDGALDVPDGTKVANGPREGGHYLVEDKAGRKSFDLDQARVYSDHLKSPGGLKTGDPEKAKGLIYFVEDPKQADSIVNQLDKANLDGRIFVATFVDGKVVFLKRTIPPPPTVRKGGTGTTRTRRRRK